MFARARIKQRQRDQQRRQEGETLIKRELKRVPEMTDQSARRQGPVFGIGKGQKVVLYEPNDMRRRCDQAATAAT